MVIPLIFAVIFYYITLKKVKNKILSRMLGVVIFLAILVVCAEMPLSWTYKNLGPGTIEKELSSFENFYNGRLIYDRVETEDICIYQEIGGDKQIADSSFYIIENDQKRAYVIKHYSKKLVLRSWAPWVLSLLFFAKSNEGCYFDYYKFYLPKGNQREFQFYKYAKIE